jgi:hypothetical protein
MNQTPKNSRREFIKKSAYAAPAILTLSAMPAIAEIGSPNISEPPGDREKCNNGLGQRVDDCQPPGMPRENDKNTTTPGNPQTQNN